MFTPIESSVGAILIWQSTSILLYNNGSVLGLSGLLRRLFDGPTLSTALFFVGMVLSFLPLRIVLPELLQYPEITWDSMTVLTTIAAGLLTGWGTKGCNGCTSGHMICGLSRFSGRSLAAVSIFFPTAVFAFHLTQPSLSTSICSGTIPCYTPVYPSPYTLTALLTLAAATITIGHTLPPLIATLSTKPEAEKSDSSPSPRTLSYLTTSLVAGLTFGLGLHISGMAQASKLFAFFALPSPTFWDPSLLAVILFGMLPAIIENKIRGFQRPPAYAPKYDIPTKTWRDIDWRFVAGAAAFGVGWGLDGTCPGPGVLRAVVQPAWGALWMAGFWAGGRLMGSHDFRRDIVWPKSLENPKP
ncbi:YeeE/YedE family integral membrane protein-like protein [Mytilinidion resinicola]|uniref:YeeE/YedE family integral membrane protein-like protein n=1 Tax=Mytilinidion resinicola TaxID=574789 RepID=A0A6A6YJ60_9PEZI|nr:YeeE/YedE family integral membrane protein-like protein [Mytilinidion resinicola]KAF2808892.1 YeeE/YedE family integral membrane protein-like protein [Mytilinidion resinicola]